LFNPFPGLRPFEADEDHLFFGREREIDDLLRRLRLTRLVAVVGTSGSGKSSLVRSGLIPSLYSGFMAGTGSSWRVAMMRPGEDPIGHLAAALDAHEVLGAEGELAGTNRVLLEATLHRGSLGLVDAVRRARIPVGDNVLLVVDQFEELFRFRRSRQIENSRDEAALFVKLLLEAARQTDVSVYVVLTMRSDFIGDCMDYLGLPEAVNAGQYLVPRMTREELRSAITGPVAVGGGAIAPRLVLRILNELGDDQDQLPILQHALMRTWDHWERRGATDGPIDIADYEAVGTLANALSRHAEEAYQETGSGRHHRTVARIFKALTDTFSDSRGVRRPTSVRELAAICETSEADIVAVVETFRAPGRSFLMPPAGLALHSRSIVDLSHESLMRCWTRLIAWAEEERAAASFYRRLSQAAAWFEEGTAGLWHNPELELARRWNVENEPTAAWAQRYDAHFDRAMEFLARSEREHARAEAVRERERKSTLRRAQWAAGVFGTLTIAAASLAVLAWRENGRAEANFTLARDAVDQTLAFTDRDPARIGADVPQMEEFRRELLGKAERFYLAFMQQKPSSEEVQRQLGYAHFRLGHINRMLAKPDDALKEYRESIGLFSGLAGRSPARSDYRQALANSYNWLGETLRSIAGRSAEAEAAYDRALVLQRRLVQEGGQRADYREELARTLYNRGILRATTTTAPNNGPPRSAEADFREAIRLLEPLADDTRDPSPAQELARVYNNLAGLMGDDPRSVEESRALYERAIQIDERLVGRDPANREYKLELAKYCNNLADLLQRGGQVDLAKRRNARALELIEDLVRPSPSLGIEQADAHNLRAVILREEGPSEVAREYRDALEIFGQLARDPDARRLPDFHVRFADLLLNLAVLRRASHDEDARRMLSEAIALYVSVTKSILDSGSAAEARMALDNLSRVLPELPDADRRTLAARSRELQEKLSPGTLAPK
jgi:tetratricopeptide (TPR) repeat protein